MITRFTTRKESPQQVRFPWAATKGGGRQVGGWLPGVLALTVMIHCIHAAEGIPDWMEMLRSKDGLVYRRGVTQLENAGATAVPELLRALELEPPASHDWDLHNGALETLTRIGRPAVPLLVQAAKAKRQAAVETLARLGPEAVEAVPVLRELVLKDPSNLGRAAAEALAAIGKQGGVSADEAPGRSV